MKGIIYKGCRLMPGSKSYELFVNKQYKELDAHEKELTVQASKRGDVKPEPKEKDD